MVTSLTRRSFLRGSPVASLPAPPRPPGGVGEAAFLAACTRCHGCVEACDETIIIIGDGGFPELDFASGGCTFCGNCQTACETGALSSAAPSWPWKAHITAQDCLSERGVTCRSCAEHCVARALSFALGLRGTATVTVDLGVCTGCGACQAPCPSGAIQMINVEPPMENETRRKIA